MGSAIIIRRFLVFNLAWLLYGSRMRSNNIDQGVTKGLRLIDPLQCLLAICHKSGSDHSGMFTVIPNLEKMISNRFQRAIYFRFKRGNACLIYPFGK